MKRDSFGYKLTEEHKENLAKAQKTRYSLEKEQEEIQNLIDRRERIAITIFSQLVTKSYKSGWSDNEIMKRTIKLTDKFIEEFDK